MPVVKIAKVLKCSSEDPMFSSQNLLLTERYKKFVSHQSNQSDRIEVDLQLACPSLITNIDLGNHGSAFLNVLVGNMDDDAGCDMVALLPDTMLQSPVDARAGRHRTSVKFFRSDSLSPSSRDRYWDRMRIILRQPYKNRDQFGLAFLKLQGKVKNDDSSLADAVPGEQKVQPSLSGEGIGGLVRAQQTTTLKANRSLSSDKKPVLQPSAAPAVRALLPGSSTHQLATAAGSTMAKAPQRLIMSRVRRVDADDVPTDNKRWYDEDDGVMLRSDFVKIEMQAKAKQAATSTADKENKSIVAPALNHLRNVINTEKSRQREEEDRTWARLAGTISPGGRPKDDDFLENACPLETPAKRKRPSSPVDTPADTTSPARQRVLTTPSCSSSFPRIGSVRGGGTDFIEFEPTTPHRTPASATSASRTPASRSVLDRIDAELQTLDKSRSSSNVCEEIDGMTPRRSFLDPWNKDKSVRGASSVNFMNSYSKNKPKLPSDVTTTVLALDGVDEVSVNDKGVRIEKRVDDDGKVTYKKIERRPLPKPVVTLNSRFKPNKQLKIGSFLEQGSSSGNGSTGWLQSGAGHTLGSSSPRVDASTQARSAEAAFAATMPCYSSTSASDRSSTVSSANVGLPPQAHDALDAEIRRFLYAVDLGSIDLEIVTFRDMRQQFEQQRGLELEKSNHRRFLNLARELVEQATASNDDILITAVSPSRGPRPSPNSASATTSAAAASSDNADCDNFVECPLCQNMFPSYAVEVHAAACSM